MEIPEAHEAVLRIILGDEKLKLLSQVRFIHIVRKNQI